LSHGVQLWYVKPSNWGAWILTVVAVILISMKNSNLEPNKMKLDWL